MTTALAVRPLDGEPDLAWVRVQPDEAEGSLAVMKGDAGDPWPLAPKKAMIDTMAALFRRRTA